jgi:PAS domain S-box-containing protein
MKIMSEPSFLPEQLSQELARLRQKAAAGKAIEQAFHAQNELLDAWVRILKTETGGLVLRSLFKHILLASSHAIGAEESNLILLDDRGIVVDILGMRGTTILQQKPIFLGQMLNVGILGWVSQFRRIGLISDTEQDERWVPILKHSEAVRSVLCVPVLQEGTLQAIVTLMHSQPAFFRYEAAQFMNALVPQISRLIESTVLFVKDREVSFTSLDSKQVNTDDFFSESIAHSLANLNHQISSVSDLPKIGIFIIYKEGKFLYLNYSVSKIFGYSIGDVLKLESILSLVASDDFVRVAENIEQCMQGETKHIACEFKGLRKDGKQIEIEVYGMRTKLSKQRVIIGALREIWSTYLQF